MERLENVNITKTSNRLTGLIAATLLVAGIGLAGTVTSAGAAVSKGSEPAAAAAPAPVQPLAAAAAAAAPGIWTVTTDWGCDGSITGSFTQTFNANGTWTTSPFVHSGRWYQVGGIVVWSFADTPALVYSGNISGSWMSGAQGYETAGGMTGCFGARVAGVPGAPGARVAPGHGDAAIGR